MEKDGGNLRNKESWYKLIGAFRFSKESEMKALSDWENFSSENVLDQLLHLLQVERDESFKINLLIFLQEHVTYFIDTLKVMEKVCSRLNGILTQSGTADAGVSFHFKGQVSKVNRTL